MKSIMKLVSANIRHKKGTFIGIAFLMMMIVISFTGTVSNNDDLKASLDEGFANVDCGDVIVSIYSGLLTDDIRGSIDSNAHISRAVYTETVIAGQKPVINGKETELLLKLKAFDEKIRVFDDKFSVFITENAAPQNGEMILPYKMRSFAEKGNEISLKASDGTELKFTVKGFYEDPLFGALTMTDYFCVISQEDMDKLMSLSDHITDSVQRLIPCTQIMTILIFFLASISLFCEGLSVESVFPVSRADIEVSALGSLAVIDNIDTVDLVLSVCGGLCNGLYDICRAVLKIYGFSLARVDVQELVYVGFQHYFEVILVHDYAVNYEAYVAFIKLILIQDIVEHLHDRFCGAVCAYHSVRAVREKRHLVFVASYLILSFLYERIVGLFDQRWVAVVLHKVARLLPEQRFELFLCAGKKLVYLLGGGDAVACDGVFFLYSLIQLREYASGIVLYSPDVCFEDIIEHIRADMMR